ncbi:MAG: phosphoribosylformylglycinamidine synthase subunit PurQ [Flavobacteriales bacterium]|jgi:phosphoribosylformylglycinamidine synthase|nr:phosphoribosylformylglycinamidine synthase subunit PurQ [Flavobacteriales bacterium]NCG29678.1 phosphoribosylformylglycinamidine synthase subunit PurQ [Bacteroidota bacterium]MBT3964633.1 phosphoribosylformylglycinamidine synthase subunit PurQ [Flavobacteriales bacterium]MBT4704403.1 phosphoribosylformylglycinamidine synthase subunit PurQ [Flavobacteriales bacterium]MBT4929486.1 phosphoribosylformylglycinamidine synthase subunit PurQ [Flavobacteriales bacterium]
MKFGVVTFPGSNCDQDMIYVLESIMDQEIARLWHKDHDLQGCDFVVLPGGFSYGDYLRSGAIARFSPIMTEVIEFANKGGYVFGVCNGFQILCESGLVEGTLQHNNNQKFVCKNVHLRTETSDSLVTRSIDKGAVLNVPIAHGEGKFFAPSDVLKGIEDNDQVLFRYCDENGQITDDANPNGSINNIAGICNSNRNVFGMMPHPERAADPNLKNEDGKKLFESILNEVLV